MEHKFVGFSIGDQHFGIDIMKVKEVSSLQKITRVPECPDFVDGVINLRGEITPIINLRKRLQIPEDHEVLHNRVIILSIEDQLVGFLVDQASTVFSITEEQIDRTPEIITNVERSYIEGIGKIDGQIVMLIDLIQILTENEQEKILDTNFGQAS